MHKEETLIADNLHLLDDAQKGKLTELHQLKSDGGVLDKICASTAVEVAKRKERVSLDAVKAKAAEAAQPRGFVEALQTTFASGKLALIAEIKKASPSKGLIRPDFEPASLAKAYQAGGATCLSVLTDEPFFMGHDDFLADALAAVPLPCLRKDFMIDPYQIYESRAIGADCVLLMLSVLEDDLIVELENIALSLGMDALIEIHDEEELARAQKLKSPLFGINNRNLKKLTSSLDTFRTLAPMVDKGRFLVAESGLYTHSDLTDLAGHGAQAYLIGEGLMRQDDVTAATKEILGLA